MEKTVNFNDVAILSVKGNDYRIHFLYMSKDEEISIMHNSNLMNKPDSYKNIFTIYKRWMEQLIIKETEKLF